MSAPVVVSIDTTQWLRRYLDRGFRIVYWLRGADPKDWKGPRDNGWNDKQRDYPPARYHDGMNVGTITGHEIAPGKYLADVDLDWADGVIFAKKLLPQTNFGFGRKSQSLTHAFYTTPERMESKKYEDIDKSCLVERRGGDSTQQTMLPPSLHPSGELLELKADGEIGHIDGLASFVRNYAIACILFKNVATRGLLHDVRLALAGFLLKAGLSELEVIAIGEAIAEITGNSVADVPATVRSTAARLTACDKKVKGGGALATALGDDGKKIVARIKEWLNEGRQLPSGAFDVTEIDLKTITPQVWKHLRDQDEPPRLFQHGGIPVRIEQVPHPNEARLVWRFQHLSRNRLRYEVAEVAEFYANFKQVVPPDAVIQNMLSTTAVAIPLPPVSRIIHAPILALDGSVQTEPGYHAATGTYYQPARGVVIPAVSDVPTNNEVAEAIDFIRLLLTDFPLVDDASKAHAIALLLLPFVRDLIDGPTPLHMITKATPGSGATLMTEVLLYPAVGHEITKISEVDNEDEWRKQITASLRKGPAAVLIDNARSITSKNIAKVLTDTVWHARILGVSVDADLPVDCVWVATGNDPTLHTEIVRRIVSAELDAGVERPWVGRTFAIPNLRGWVHDHRGKLIWAALTIARAWHVRGRKAGDAELGMFESWSAVMGGLLKVANVPGFLGNLQNLYDSADVEGDALRWFITGWIQEHSTKPVTLSLVGVWALNSDSPLLNLLPTGSIHGLHTAFGTLVRKLRRRVFVVEGKSYRVEAVKTSRPPTWQVVELPTQQTLTPEHEV